MGIHQINVALPLCDTFIYRGTLPTLVKQSEELREEMLLTVGSPVFIMYYQVPIILPSLLRAYF
jgi:hypothetical protein